MTTETPERFLHEISTVAAAEKYHMTSSYVARLARTHTIRARKGGEMPDTSRGQGEHHAQPKG